MKVVIAGSRTILDYSSVARAVERSKFDINEVVCGMAAGVDTLGERWAISRGIPIKYMPADWKRHGKSAGPIRNMQMAEYADAAVIVWDGKSPGALNMINQMKKINKPYFIEVNKDDEFSFFD